MSKGRYTFPLEIAAWESERKEGANAPMMMMMMMMSRDD
jgi:hypothetical protein